MLTSIKLRDYHRLSHKNRRFDWWPTILIIVVPLIFPLVAYAQTGSPFDTGFTNLQNLFTGTVAKVASLVAIVIGGFGFAHGEPGAKNHSGAAVR